MEHTQLCFVCRPILASRLDALSADIFHLQSRHNRSTMWVQRSRQSRHASDSSVPTFLEIQREKCEPLFPNRNAGFFLDWLLVDCFLHAFVALAHGRLQAFTNRPTYQPTYPHGACCDIHIQHPDETSVHKHLLNHKGDSLDSGTSTVIPAIRNDRMGLVMMKR